jgi:hypothetical protein
MPKPSEMQLAAARASVAAQRAVDPSTDLSVEDVLEDEEMGEANIVTISDHGNSFSAGNAAAALKGADFFEARTPFPLQNAKSPDFRRLYVVIPMDQRGFEEGDGRRVRCKRVGEDGPNFGFDHADLRNYGSQGFHSKTLLRCRRQSDGSIGGPAILYVGSHNFTQRAWGQIFKRTLDGRGKEKAGRVDGGNFEVRVRMRVSTSSALHYSTVLFCTVLYSIVVLYWTDI